MHTIEPFHRWRLDYNPNADKHSPFYKRTYNLMGYDKRIYNYLIHPQWDDIGSETLYIKVLYAEYDEGYCIVELLGEWNDCLHNDIETLKNEVLDLFLEAGIRRYVFLCENLLNMHAGEDDDYYAEWHEALGDDGWVCFINTRDHVRDELTDNGLDRYILLGESFNELVWRPQKPQIVYAMVEERIREYREDLDVERYELD